LLRPQAPRPQSQPPPPPKTVAAFSTASQCRPPRRDPPASASHRDLTSIQLRHGGSPGYSSCVSATVTCSIRCSSCPTVQPRRGPRIRRPHPRLCTAVAIRSFGRPLRLLQGWSTRSGIRHAMTRPKVPPDQRQRTAQACESCKRRKQKVASPTHLHLYLSSPSVELPASADQ
jgi:hypothetical protein